MQFTGKLEHMHETAPRIHEALPMNNAENEFVSYICELLPQWNKSAGFTM